MFELRFLPTTIFLLCGFSFWLLHARSFEEIIQAASPAELTMGSGARWLQVRRVTYNVSIDENALGNFSNLYKLYINGTYSNSTERFLDIDPRAFRHTPHLTWLLISGFRLTDSTIRAIGTLNDQLVKLYLGDAQLTDSTTTFPPLSNFTRLEQMIMEDVCIGDLIPPPVHVRSPPSTLGRLSISHCPPSDSKITTRMFANMPNLVWLQWVHSNITEIEAHSFDANPKLEILSFYGNRIQSLPDGLFSRLTELPDVDFRFNDGLRGLSRSNFTHVKHFTGRFNLNS